MPAVSAANTHVLFLHLRADLPPLPEEWFPEGRNSPEQSVRRQQADCPKPYCAAHTEQTTFRTS